MTLLTQHLATWIAADTAEKSGRGRSAEARLYGVKKLRELILELAVRGLLVPQNADDEPASELLKKIAAEKAKLIKEGKIKAQKPLPPIENDEKPFDLPKGWEWVRLGDISQINPRNDANDAIEASFVPMTLISTSHTGKHEQEIKLWGEIKKGFTHFAENDIGVAKITPCFENSKAAVFTGLKNGIGAGTTELHIIRPLNKTLTPRYVLIYLKAPQFLNFGESKMTGTAGQKRLPKDFVAENPCPLPPLPEQQRIVVKVDELMALCDQLEQQQNNSQAAHQQLVSQLLNALTQAANTNDFQQAWQRIATHFDVLFTTEDSINQLKQSILQLAVMGKLVPQNPNDEPASQLLKKIAAEKAKLVKEGKIKAQKPLPPIGDDEKPFELPKGWEWVRLDNIITLMDAGWSPACLPTPSPSNDVWGVLKTTSVQTMQYLECENKELPNKLEPRPQYEAKSGDVLITRAGPRNRVGICCFVEKTRQRLMISDKIIRFRLFDIGFSGKYIALCLSVGVTADYLEITKSGMAESQVNISQDKLKLAPIVLPPLAEQQRIVTKVDELMALCDQLKTQLNQAKHLQGKIADVLVEQALSTNV